MPTTYTQTQDTDGRTERLADTESDTENFELFVYGLNSFCKSLLQFNLEVDNPYGQKQDKMAIHGCATIQVANIQIKCDLESEGFLPFGRTQACQAPS